ncbi:hypothetical protein [Symbiopectobacterium purcellii]|uniref:hypothetical protein n=1 Tax=Symbiopectobacterium purcellii TaxID=2871826 RepID=UPI003F82BB8D
MPNTTPAAMTLSTSSVPHAFTIANRLKNDYILCPDMRQRIIAGCYQNNVVWLYHHEALLNNLTV